MGNPLLPWFIINCRSTAPVVIHGWFIYPLRRSGGSSITEYLRYVKYKQRPGFVRYLAVRPQAHKRRPQTGRAARPGRLAVVAKRQTCWEGKPMSSLVKQLNNNDENDENLTRSSSFITSIEVASK